MMCLLDPPEDIKIIPNVSSIVIIWSSPVLPAHHTSVTKYNLIVVATNGTADPRNIIVDVMQDKSRLTETVDQLAPFTQYEISIATGTKFGFGPPVCKVNRTRIGGTDLSSALQ